MAAASPALSNNRTDVVAPSTGGNSLNNIHGGSNSSKSQRGLNKPKCIKSGNVARSRCPYQSCKNCCAKAQNPCHIHGKQSKKKLNSFRVASLRQLSNNFAQFNNLQSPLRSRKPLTKKEALIINEWMFLKLKEYRDRNIEGENDAFDRYMQNVCLLEEVLSASATLEELKKHPSPVSNSCPKSEQNDETVSNPDPNSENHEMIPNPDLNSDENPEMITNPNPNFEQNDEPIPNPDPNSEQNHEMIPNHEPNSEQNPEMIPSPNPNCEQNDESMPNPDSNSEQNHEMTFQLKLKFRPEPERIGSSRVQYILDQGLKKLPKLGTPNVVCNFSSDETKLMKKPKRADYSHVERVMGLHDLVEKLSKAQNGKDIKLCRQIKSLIFDTCKKANGESGDIETLDQKDDTKADSHKHQSEYFAPKRFSTVTVDQDAVKRIDAHFSSLEEIEDL